MPRISSFHGIAIYMYYRDHEPAHFHAIYGDFEAMVAIASGAILEGALPRRARRLIVRWWSEHVDDLVENWELARRAEPLRDIAPLT